jgi:hypothetical protein
LADDAARRNGSDLHEARYDGDEHAECECCPYDGHAGDCNQIGLVTSS